MGPAIYPSQRRDRQLLFVNEQGVAKVGPLSSALHFVSERTYILQWPTRNSLKARSPSPGMSSTAVVCTPGPAAGKQVELPS